ncbi:MAG: hypothetical protein FJ386_14320 [Verrucomicrobia bacterium]|nr:hypothetical protein [Verrucomicrobiota bacterium]
MTTSKRDTSCVFEPFTIQTRETQFTLPADSLLVRRNGIEFRSPTPLDEWTELTLDMHSPRDGHREQATGVVVACRGTHAAGFAVSVVLMGMTPAAERLLQQAAISPLA